MTDNAIVDAINRELASLLKSGDTQGFLSRLAQSDCAAIIRGVIGKHFKVKNADTKDDLFQEVLLGTTRFLQHKNIEGNTPLRFVFRVARNVAINAHRKASTRKERVSAPTLLADIPNKRPYYWDPLSSAVENLPPKQQMLFELCVQHMEELFCDSTVRYPELAKRLRERAGGSDTAEDVKMQLQEALYTVRSRLLDWQKIKNRIFILDRSDYNNDEIFDTDLRILIEVMSGKLPDSFLLEPKAEDLLPVTEEEMEATRRAGEGFLKKLRGGSLELGFGSTR